MESSPLLRYIVEHTRRGPAGAEAPGPAGDTVDLVFFSITRQGDPDAATLRRLTEAHPGDMARCNPLDGEEHGYM